MKIIAFILLAAGMCLGALGAYGFFFSADHESCRRAVAMAEEKMREARAAQGTPRAGTLMEEARIENDSVEFTCRNAARTRQSSTWTALGGLAAVIASVVPLLASRKRAA